MADRASRPSAPAAMARPAARSAFSTWKRPTSGTTTSSPLAKRTRWAAPSLRTSVTSSAAPVPGAPMGRMGRPRVHPQARAVAA